MVYTEYKKVGIKIGHLWFSDGQYKGYHPDILYLHGMRTNIGGGGKQHTLITNLSNPEEEIYKKIRKNYRYEIRHVEKENVKLEFYSAKEMSEKKELVSSFATTYNQMYASKGINAKFNMPLVKEYMQKAAICFTIAYYNGEPLVFHSYIVDKNNARFFYSASPFREKKDVATIIGQMNKALHWFDIKTFRNMGITQYDWGGIANPEEPNGIDQFKMGFGGEATSYYNVIIGVSLLGKITLSSMKAKEKLYKYVRKE